jgi:hypothetical protein
MFDPPVTVFQTARFTSTLAKRQRSATISTARELRQSGAGGFLYGVNARQTSTVGSRQRSTDGNSTPGVGSACASATTAQPVTSMRQR